MKELINVLFCSNSFPSISSHMKIEARGTPDSTYLVRLVYTLRHGIGGVLGNMSFVIVLERRQLIAIIKVITMSLYV